MKVIKKNKVWKKKLEETLDIDDKLKRNMTPEIEIFTFESNASRTNNWKTLNSIRFSNPEEIAKLKNKTYSLKVGKFEIELFQCE